MGIPSKVMLKEERASNTFEDARFSCDVLAEKNFYVIVCKPFHAQACFTYLSVLFTY